MRWRFWSQQPVRSGFHAISSDGTEIEVDCDKMVRQLRNALHQGGTETSVSDHDARLFLSRHHWDVESALKEAEDACAHNLMKAKREGWLNDHEFSAVLDALQKSLAVQSATEPGADIDLQLKQPIRLCVENSGVICT